MSANKVIFEAGTVVRDYGDVTVALHASRDVTSDDWMNSMRRFSTQVEAGRKEVANAGSIATEVGGAA